MLIVRDHRDIVLAEIDIHFNQVHAQFAGFLYRQKCILGIITAESAVSADKQAVTGQQTFQLCHFISLSQSQPWHP